MDLLLLTNKILIKMNKKKDQNLFSFKFMDPQKKKNRSNNL